MGIGALVGIMACIDAISKVMTSNFLDLGAGAFTMRANEYQYGAVKDENPEISFFEAETFKKKYDFPSLVSISVEVSDIAKVKYLDKETNPNVVVTGVDLEYLKIKGRDVNEGRSFSVPELDNGVNVALIGQDVVRKVYEKKDTVIGSSLSIEGKKYTIIGMLTSKGATASSNDNIIYIPIESAKKMFNVSQSPIEIIVEATDPEKIDLAQEEARGVFRGIRRVDVLGGGQFFDGKK